MLRVVCLRLISLTNLMPVSSLFNFKSSSSADTTPNFENKSELFASETHCITFGICFYNLFPYVFFLEPPDVQEIIDLSNDEASTSSLSNV